MGSFMIKDIVKRAKKACPACLAEFGVHKYMPSNAYGAETLKKEFGDKDEILVHLDFIDGFAVCLSGSILEEAITGRDDKSNPTFIDGFNEAFYVEEEEEEEEPAQDEDLPL